MPIIKQIATSSEVVAMMKITSPATGSIMDEDQEITMKRNRRYYGYIFCASGKKATMDWEVKPKSLGPEKMQMIKDRRKGANCLSVSRVFAPSVSDLEERVFSVAWLPFLLFFLWARCPSRKKMVIVLK